jgi:hypothetical protein
VDTLGRAIVTQQNGTNQILSSLRLNGVLRIYTVNYASISLSTTNVSRATAYHQYTGTRNKITSVVLPNGRSYSFQYETNGFGGISRIDLPSGAYVTYTWATWSDYERSYRYVTSRTLNVDGQSYTWSFSRGACIPGTGCQSYQVTVTDPLTDPLQNQSVYVTDHGSITSAKLYNGPATGTPLREYTVVYTGRPSQRG